MFTAARGSSKLLTLGSAVTLPGSPNPRHTSRAASFFGAMALMVLLIGACIAVAAL